MSKSSKSYIGLDVHKDSIDIAIADSGEHGVGGELVIVTRNRSLKQS